MIPAEQAASRQNRPSSAAHYAQQCIDTRDLRNALGKFPTGVCVITTRGPQGKLEGLTANSFCSVSLDPPIVSWSLRKDAGSLPAFLQATHFCINILHSEQVELSRHFCSRQLDKFDGRGDDFQEGLEGIPTLKDALATFECERLDHHAVGDHIVFYGTVKRYAYSDQTPLGFHGGGYITVHPLPG